MPTKMRRKSQTLIYLTMLSSNSSNQFIWISLFYIILFVCKISSLSEGVVSEDATNSFAKQKSDRLWLFNGVGKEESQNYLYVLKDNLQATNETTLVELTDLKRLPKEGLPLNGSNLSHPASVTEMDLDPSASSLKITSIGRREANKLNESTIILTHRSDYTSKINDKKKGNIHKQQQSLQNQQNLSNSNNKNKLNNLFRSPSKKLTISTFLHTKSKRQDALKPNNSRSGKISHRMVHPNHRFLPRAIPDQPLIPFNGNHHLLFGSHIPLPGSYFDIHTGPDDLIGPPPSGQIQTQPTIPHAYHQSLAHPSIDYHGQTELTPIFFPSSSRTGQMLATGNSNKHNIINNNSNKSTTPKPVQNKTRETSAPQATSNFSPISLPLGAAAAALFSERAKNFINHLNRGSSSFTGKKKETIQKGSNSSTSNTNSSSNNSNTNNANSSTNTNGNKSTKGTRDLVTDQANANGNINTNANLNVPTGPVGLVKTGPDNLGLASMIKNAADTWATSNPGSEPAPSIIVEHDGPAITTVDFGPNQNIRHTRLPIQPDQGGEDEVVNSFYEGEDEESYVEGSNEAKRFVSLKPQYRNPHLQHHQHHNQPHPPGSLHRTLHHHHSSGYGGLGSAPHYPFEQQVQSHNVQTEVPLDSFYSTGVERDLTDRTKKSPYSSLAPSDYSTVENNQFNDYSRIHKLFEQPSIYPDSINAIKEQNNGNEEKVAGLISNLGSNLSDSNSEQIELLIKELQKLNKKKQQSQNVDDTNGDANQSDSNNNKSSKKAKGSSSSGLSDDYEDLLANSDEDEDEKLKVLRKKLLARLRSKTSRKRPNSAGESFHNEAIKIPLHALLLAALDRRMSPSELSQTVLSDLIDDDNKKKTSSSEGSSMQNRQQDFNEVTSGLGSLIGYDSTLTHGSTTPTPHLTDLRENAYSFEREMNNSNLQPYKEPQEFTPHAPNMFILNNIRLPDQLSTQKNNDSSLTTATLESTIDLMKPQNLSSDPDEQLYSSQTTKLPSILRGDNYSDRDKIRVYKSTRNINDKSKKRRELDRNSESDDFDVNRQVEEFSRDKADETNSLEPEWTVRGLRGKSGAKSGDKSVHFDDDFEELAKATRRKILKRRRKPPNEEELDAEIRFFNKMQRDTNTLDKNPGDFDKSLHDVEDPIGLASQEQDRQARRRARAHEFDDEIDNTSNTNRIRLEPLLDNDDAEPEEENRRSKESTDSNWKPHMIDEEVRKIENFARSKERAAREHGYEPSDYSDNDDGHNQVFEEAESHDFVTTVKPDSILKVTIDAQNGTGARITQHFKSQQPH